MCDRRDEICSLPPAPRIFVARRLCGSPRLEDTEDDLLTVEDISRGIFLCFQISSLTAFSFFIINF